MKTLKRAFNAVFPLVTAEDKEAMQVYKEWNFLRDQAAVYGPNHVAEIDAIFTRNGY